MAQRPIFLPSSSDNALVDINLIDLTWYSGFAKSQYQRSIASLHENAVNEGIAPALEISSKSPIELGVSLSAFNLEITFPNDQILSVETAFPLIYTNMKIFIKFPLQTCPYGFVNRLQRKYFGVHIIAEDLIFGFD